MGSFFEGEKNEGKRVKTVVEKWHLWLRCGVGWPRPTSLNFWPNKQPKERKKEGTMSGQRLIKGVEAGLRITFDASWVFVFEFKRRCRT
jgi:hypothetical protein